MDKERKKRRQLVKIIATEAFMVVFVIVMVVVLSLVAMGYNLDEEWKLDQSGLVQVYSKPSGAKIEFDGEEILAKTNTSKMLSAGEHTIKLTKEGYDSWEKTINVASGWLLKLDYPRLFRQDMPIETVREMKDGLEFFETGDGMLLYAEEGSLTWIQMGIRADDVTETKIDVSGIISTDVDVESVKMANNGDKALVRAGGEWILVNLRDAAQSMNLTKEFGVNIAEIKALNAGMDRLLILEQGNLREISVTDKKLSTVMANEVSEYAVSGTEVIYLRKQDVMLYKSGGKDIKLTEVEKDKKIKLSFSQYLSNYYVGMMVNNRIFVYVGKLPVESIKEMRVVAENDTEVTPSVFEVMSEGRLIIAKDGKKIVMFDAEIGKISEYELEAENYRMIDEYLIATVADGKMVVRDFDGTNRRELFEATDSPATITSNGKWIYYTAQNSAGVSEIRRVRITL